MKQAIYWVTLLPLILGVFISCVESSSSYEQEQGRKAYLDARERRIQEIEDRFDEENNQIRQRLKESLEIVSARVYTDEFFKKTTRVKVKNISSKTITTMIFNKFSLDASGEELVTKKIRPGESTTVTISGAFAYPTGVSVIGLRFSDGSALRLMNSKDLWERTQWVN